MDCFKSAVMLALLLAAGVAAEKKIELQDIEEDNLKSEKQTDYEKPEPQQSTTATDQDLVPLEFLKSGILRYFEKPHNQPQQQRYVHQYAVNEPVEKPHQNYQQKAQTAHSPPSGPQRAMLGYLSNMPMQIYLVPQYSNQEQQESSHHPGLAYTAPTAIGRAAAYHAPEASPAQTQYVEVPSYVVPSGKAYIAPQYPAAPQVTYVTYAPQPAAAVNNLVATGPPPTAAPLAYQMPLVQYQTALVSPPQQKAYYPTAQYVTETNTVEETVENEVESPKQYATQTEVPYTKPTASDYYRYYSRTPQDYRQNVVSELPHPNPLLLRGHTSHIPKALPVFRPMAKSIYSGGMSANAIPTGYAYPYRRRPTSLLDSYIPSSVQLEYMKRGYSKDPLSAYEALSSARSLYPAPPPRHLERGFLPNQMYHTAAGGVTYGHYKRTAKADKPAHT